MPLIRRLESLQGLAPAEAQLTCTAALPCLPAARGSAETLLAAKLGPQGRTTQGRLHAHCTIVHADCGLGAGSNSGAGSSGQEAEASTPSQDESGHQVVFMWQARQAEAHYREAVSGAHVHRSAQLLLSCDDSLCSMMPHIQSGV